MTSYEAPLKGGDIFEVSVPRTDFGTWRLDGDELVLKRQDWCRIDLEQCNSSAQILDWIFHYQNKGLRPQELADMLQAIRVILHPAANFCSYGVSKRASGLKLLAAHLARFRQPEDPSPKSRRVQ